MRIEIREGDDKAVVTRSVPVVPTNPVRKAQLECQASLWKPGDVLASKLHDENDHLVGSITVRDWGVVGGACKHQDSHEGATFSLPPGKDTLAVAVRRGKSITVQDWTRVR